MKVASNTFSTILYFCQQLFGKKDGFCGEIVAKNQSTFASVV